MSRAIAARAPGGHVEFGHCVRCSICDFCWRGQCAECFRETHEVIVRRTWSGEIRRDWVLHLAPRLNAWWASTSDPTRWPAPMLLGAFVAVVAINVWVLK